MLEKMLAAVPMLLACCAYAQMDGVASCNSLYVMSGYQEYCVDDRDITSQKECSEAAHDLDLPYGTPAYWPGDHKSCSLAVSDTGKQMIFFNLAGDRASSSPSVTSVCRAQEAFMYEVPDYKYRSDLLWTDPEFPPDSSSLGQGSPEAEWIRAMDLNRGRDDFVWDTVSSYDPRQGSVSDCWLVSALSSAAHHADLIIGMFTDASRQINREGWYEFWFWDIRMGREGGPEGQWALVLVDDFIPCDPRDQKATFMRTKTDGELWPLLLEKGFAKFVGSYEGMAIGQSVWAWQAMGVCEDIRFYYADPDNPVWEIHNNDVDQQRRMMAEGKRRSTWQHLVKTVARDDLFDHLSGNIHGLLASATCCRNDLGCGKDNFAEGTYCDSFGLVAGHVYSLLMATQVWTESGEEKLLLIRNPWANDKVYLGDWGPNSRKWQDHPDAKRQVEAVMHEKNHKGDDGVWWMSLNDFNYFFREINECVLAPRQPREDLSE